MIINRFSSLLDKYEENLSLISTDFNKVDDAVLNLKSALDLLIISHPLDSFQMMRIFVAKALTTTIFSNSTIITIIDKATQMGAASLIMAIPYTFNKITPETPFESTELWFGSVNFNKAIKLFFETYLESDLYLMQTINTDNLIEVTSEKDLDGNDFQEDLITLILGRDNLKINLKAFKKQIVKLTTDPSIDLPLTYDTSLPLTIKTRIGVSAGIREFILDKSVKFTQNALSIIELADFVENQAGFNSNIKFTLPNHFYRYQLELLSLNSGDTWYVTNILVQDSSFY